jgi:endonuclease/exonuclease/phosphatase family metal-dependent hydrolase
MNMKWMRCIVGCLLLAVIGCSSQQEFRHLQGEGSDIDPGVIDVMTFNIRFGTANDGMNRWDNRRELVVDVIAKHDPDILGLQEALDFQVNYISKEMPEYDVYYVCRDDGAKQGESSAIFYRKNRFKLTDSGTFWFSNTPSEPSAHWGNKHLRICSWVQLIDKKDDIRFYVYNLHLDHVSQNSREKSTILLAEKISQRKHSGPYIVMGDFNMSLSNPGIKYLLKNDADTPYPPLVSAWHRKHPQLDTRTGHGFKGITEGSAIDHILVEEKTSVINANIDQRAINGRYPSDHYPVISRVKLY